MEVLRTIFFKGVTSFCLDQNVEVTGSPIWAQKNEEPLDINTLKPKLGVSWHLGGTNPE